MNKKKILISDDDPAIVDSLTLLLERVGYEVQTTVNGDTVPDLHRYKSDILLLDIWMAGWDGRDICRQIKNNKDTEHVPVIIISANKDTAKIAKEIGADDFLAKPFEIQDLLSAIDKQLKK